MFMRTVTLEMEKFTGARTQICNPPRFLDGQTGTFAMRRNKTVHTSIEVSKSEAILLQETDNIQISPISATTWPLDKNGDTEGNGETRNFFEYFPKLSKSFLNSAQCPLISLTVELPLCIVTWVQEVLPVQGLENQSADFRPDNVSRHLSKVQMEHQSSFLPIGMTLHPFDHGFFSDRREPGLVHPSIMTLL